MDRWSALTVKFLCIKPARLRHAARGLRRCPRWFAEIGQQGLSQQCASQESKLAVLWNIGIFALNFGPVIIGPILDYVGPKLTAILGELTSASLATHISVELRYLGC